jgi:hypothetical protein
MTRNAESAAGWNLIPERWGSLLVQEEYRGEMACDMRRRRRRQQQQRHNNNNSNNNNSNDNLSSVLTMLDATCRLTPSCHDGSLRSLAHRLTAKHSVSIDTCCCKICVVKLPDLLENYCRVNWYFQAIRM